MTTQTLGPIMADIAGLRLTPEDREVLSHPLVGGVILFSRNYADRGQLRALCEELLALRRPRLLLAVDYEGGRVQRFRQGFTAIPPMRTLGDLHAQAPAQARVEARRLAGVIGQELGAFGIDLCFAPVLDVDHGVSAIIGDRAFADDAAVVTTLAEAFCAGLAATGMAATGKHFPGHGAVVPDSHHELPVDERSFEALEAVDLVPFRALMEQGLPSIMMAHVRYTCFDVTPASLSRRWIRGYLRRRLRYQGAVFCDDLSMGGAAVVGGLVDRARMALEAGCDMLPVCNDRPGTIEVLEGLRGFRISPSASRRLRRLYRRPGVST